MASRVEQYVVHINTPGLSNMPVARVGLQEDHGVLSRMQWRYLPGYLAHPCAFSLDPVQLPLQNKDISLSCLSGGIPAILDDYLPDAWGRSVLVSLAFYQRQVRLRTHSPLDMLSVLGVNRIGALQWLLAGKQADYTLGADITHIAKAEQAAQAIEVADWQDVSVDEFSLTYLANAGTGVGGARPKALVQKNGKAYLAKFNSLSKDTYNNAKVELACLLMAEFAGVHVFTGECMGGINGRDVLLLKRFDVVEGRRRHVISVNAMLKDQHSQRDREGVFRYDDVADLIKKYSIDPQSDLEELLRIMLFNSAINNTDDHERNFSFWHDGLGYRLAPAYDLVPSLTMGQYHVAGFGYSPIIPLPSQVAGRVFGLPAPKVQSIAQDVKSAIAAWPRFAALAGVSDSDSAAVGKVLNV